MSVERIERLVCDVCNQGIEGAPSEEIQMILLILLFSKKQQVVKIKDTHL